MIKDYAKLSYNSLIHRGLRSWLTVIGIVIGIAAVIGLMLIGEGLQNAIKEQVTKAGANKIVISPGRGGTMFSLLETNKLSEHDLDIVKEIRGLEKAGGFIISYTKIGFKKEIEYTFVMGISEETKLQDFFGVNIENGRDLQKGDEYKAVIGYLINHDDFFDKPVKIGETITIQDKEFQVIGNLDRIGNRQDDTQIYIPIETAKKLFNEKRYAMIFAKTEEGYDTTKVAEEIKERLRKDRNQKPGEEDFSVQTYEQLIKTFTDILGIVNIAIIGIATISLLVGGVGIMNTMYTSVLERTKQIGIMKAVGAKEKHILITFLLESGIIGLIGGFFGVAIGLILAKLVEFVAITAGFYMLKITFDMKIILFGLLFAFFVGIISGVLPARQAAKLKPVEALRYE